MPQQRQNEGIKTVMASNRLYISEPITHPPTFGEWRSPGFRNDLYCVGLGGALNSILTHPGLKFIKKPRKRD